MYLFCSLIEEGGDWDRRNRLKVYRGLYSMSVRDFKTAAGLFLDTVATFTSYELMDYKTFVTYTVLSCMIALPRTDLREKVRTIDIVYDLWLLSSCKTNLPILLNHLETLFIICFHSTTLVHLRVQVVRGAEILEVLFGLPEVKKYLFSLYNCQYADFFQSLGKLKARQLPETKK